MNMASNGDSRQFLVGNYTSPTSTNKFEIALPKIPHPNDKAEKTAYLGEMRKAITSLQSNVNSYLTKKMDDDKAIANSNIDERKEEENYGEEIDDA